MHILVEEYGLMVITIVCVVLFMSIIHMLLYGDDESGTKSMGFVFRTNTVGLESMYFDSNGNPTELSSRVVQYSPFFESKEDIEYYKIQKNSRHPSDDNIFTVEDAMDIVDIYVSDAAHPGTKQAYKGAVDIWVTKYDLRMTRWLNKSGEAYWYEGDELKYISMEMDCPPGYTSSAEAIADGWTHLSNPTPVYEKINATDKYGNTIFEKEADGKTYKKDASGKRIPKQVEVLSYDVNKGDPFNGQSVKLGSTDLPNITVATPTDGTPYSRYRLTYRVQFGTKKAEFTTLLLKDRQN